MSVECLHRHYLAQLRVPLLGNDRRTLAGARLLMGQMIGAKATEDTTLENQAINPIGVVFHTETWSLLRPQSSLFVATHRINAIKLQRLVISLHVS